MARAHNWAGRVRVLRPEIFRDEKLAELTPTENLLFIGLLVFSTATGEIPADTTSISQAVFPYRPETDVDAGLAAIEREGLIERRGANFQIVSLERYVQLKPEASDHAGQARRRARKRMAAPAWANRDAIRAIYREAKQKIKETGQSWHVDHVIPLSGKTVCGLHVESNLQIIPGADNIRKSNKFDAEAQHG